MLIKEGMGKSNYMCSYVSKNARKALISSILIIAVLAISVLNHTVDAAEISYYIYDSPERSVVSVINKNGEVVNKYSYDAYGNIVSRIEGVTNDFNYVGEQLDSETGLIFLRQRYYDPGSGRFITKDPKPGLEKNPQSLTPYIYCLNNPILLTDPSGTYALWIAITAGVLAVVYLIQNLAWSVGKYPSSGLKGGALSTNFMYEVEQLRARDRNNYYGNGPGGGGSSLSTRGSLSSSGSLRSSLSRSYGGVSLSKTAQLMLNINDVAGATYDERTGQIILFGKEDLSLPQMDIDDLSVAVNSVYSGEDPGVSIGTEPSGVPGWMKVRTRIYADYTRMTADNPYKSVSNPFASLNIIGMMVLIALGMDRRRREWVRV